MEESLYPSLHPPSAPMFFTQAPSAPPSAPPSTYHHHHHQQQHQQQQHQYPILDDTSVRRTNSFYPPFGDEFLLSTPSAPPLYPIHPSNRPNSHRPASPHTSYPHLGSDPAYTALPARQPSLPPPLQPVIDHHEVNLGLTEEQLASNYSNNLLAQLPLVLNRFQARSLQIHSNILYERLKNLESATKGIQDIKLGIFTLKKKATSYASRLWTVHTQEDVVRSICADGATISHTYSFQRGSYESTVAAKLKKVLFRLRKQKTRNLVRMQFEEATARLWIDEHLALFISSSVWAKETTMQRNGMDAGQAGDEQRAAKDRDVEALKGLLDVLFHFERSVSRQSSRALGSLDEKDGAETANQSDNDHDSGINNHSIENDNDITTSQSNSPTNTLLQTIQGWIVLLVPFLLTSADPENHCYLLLHVLQTRCFSSWAACLIQSTIPDIWSSSFVDLYLTQLHILFAGTSGQITTSAAGSGLDDFAVELGQTAQEEDLIAIVDQLDIPFFFQRMLVEQTAGIFIDGTSAYQQGLSEKRTLRLFAMARALINTICQGVSKLTRFPLLTKQMAQILSQLAQILGDHLLVAGPLHSNKKLSLNLYLSHQGHKTSLQQEFDNFLLTIMRFLMELPSHGLWNFLDSIPVKFLSNNSVVIFLEEFALQGTSNYITDPAGLISVSTLDTPGPHSKLRVIVGQNPSEGIFLLTALADMAASRFESNSRLGQSTAFQDISHQIAVIVSFLLVDVAFLDADVGQELRKPVRDIASQICGYDPTVISFLLKMVEKQFEGKGGSALYLFKELPLELWDIDESDFAILFGMFSIEPLGCEEHVFAREVLGSLPWQGRGVSTSAPEISLSTHGDFAVLIANTMLLNSTGINLHHSKDPKSVTSPKITEVAPSSPFSSGIPLALANFANQRGIVISKEQATLKAGMDWSWSMLLKLRLIDAPVITLRQASGLHTPNISTSQWSMLTQGPAVFGNTVHFLLTSASRELDGLLNEGWLTIEHVLHCGMGYVALELLTALTNRYFSSGQNMAGHTEKFHHLLHEITLFKADPFLETTGKKFAYFHELDTAHVQANHLALWSVLTMQLTSSTLWEYSAKPVEILQFWITSIVCKKDWMFQSEWVQVMDMICQLAFQQGFSRIVFDALEEQQILLSIEYRRSPGVTGELMGLAQPGLDKVLDILPERFSRALPLPQGSNDPSLLVGNWSVKSFAANFLNQMAMVETKAVWFAYYALMVEKHLEQEMRIKIGNHYHHHTGPSQNIAGIKTIVKSLGITTRKTLHNFVIYRLAQHLLVLPHNAPILPLFWMQFLHLYFAHTDSPQVFYGIRFLETSPELMAQVRARAKLLTETFGRQARQAIQGQDVDSAEKSTTLHDLYLAISAWLDEPQLLTSMVDFRRIREELLPNRLQSCHLSDTQTLDDGQWMDLVFLETQSWDHGKTNSVPPSPSFSNSLPFGPNLAPRQNSKDGQRRARLLRVNSHARQDQKINAFLTKRAKPPPIFFFPKPMVGSLHVDETTTASKLFGQNLRTIQNHAKAYKDITANGEQLDSSYVKDLAALYYNDSKVIQLDIACDATPNSLCKKPAHFELRYEEIVLNQNVRKSIIENREREKHTCKSEIRMDLCVATLEVTRWIQQILNNPEQYKDLAQQSFFRFSEYLLEDAKVFPPALVIMQMVVDTLGMGVISDDRDQTEPLLKAMGQSEFAITLYSKIFNPAKLGGPDFVTLYRQIATNQEYDLRSKDKLLKRFDVETWTTNAKELGVTVQDRMAFYQVAFSAMISQEWGQKHAAQLENSVQQQELTEQERLNIIRSHRELAGTLLLNNLQFDYTEYLRVLFDTCGMMCLEPEALDDYIRILGVDPKAVPLLLDGRTSSNNGLVGQRDRFDYPNYHSRQATSEDIPEGATRINLSDYDFACLVRFLADYFVDCQDKMIVGNLLDRYDGYTVSIANLLTVVLCEERYLNRWMMVGGDAGAGGNYASLVTGNYLRNSIHGSPTVKIWHDTVAVFRPWLLCLSDHAVDEIRFQRQQGGASRILFTFVGLVNKLVETVRTRRWLATNQISVLILDCYLDLIVGIVGRGSINQTMLIHQHFQRLDWKGLELSAENVTKIMNTQARLNVEERIEFWVYMVNVVMAGAATDLRPSSRVSSGYNLDCEDFSNRPLDSQLEAGLFALAIQILQDVDIIAGTDLKLRRQLLRQLAQSILSPGDWTQLEFEELKHHVQAIKLHWDRADTLHNMDRPLPVLLHWLRKATGLEFVDEEGGSRTSATSHMSDSTSSLDRLDKSSRVDRALIYFNFVLELLKVRMVSSAQDSQNVNFSMDTIPAVIIHLGTVLDSIGGNRFHAKHSLIYRPLSMLAVLLNDASKGTLLYENVSKGLEQMIGHLHTIQLDVIRVISQWVTSIPVMLLLLELAIQREFELWREHQRQYLTNVAGPENGTFPTTIRDRPASPLMLSDEMYTSSIHGGGGPAPRVSIHRNGRQSWTKIKHQLDGPKLSEEKFMDESVHRGAMLTTYVRYLQRLDAVCEEEGGFEFDSILELGQELAQDISRFDLKAVAFKAFHIFLLVQLFLDLVAKEAVHSIAQSRFRMPIILIANTLHRWCQDKEPTKGLLGSIGMGPKSVFDTRFRLVSRMLHTFLAVRLADKGILPEDLVPVSTTPPNSGSFSVAKIIPGSPKKELALSSGTTTAGNKMVAANEMRTQMIDQLANVAIKNKDYEAVFKASAVSSSSSSSLLSTAHQHQGTKNGLADLEWAVQQASDRRLGALEAGEFMKQLLDRFYVSEPMFV